MDKLNKLEEDIKNAARQNKTDDALKLLIKYIKLDPKAPDEIKNMPEQILYSELLPLFLNGKFKFTT